MISDNKYGRVVRLNESLRANIWDALRKEGAINPMQMGSLSIEVEGGEVFLNGYLPPENNLPLIENIIYSVLGVVEVHNQLRTNDGILSDTWDALWKEDLIRSIDLGSLSIQVKDGEVFLNGHVAQENNLRLIEKIARSVPGVVAVHNNLVFDWDLVVQVAQALAKDECTRSYILPVGASHGWIRLGGEVPSREIQLAAEKVAAGVPGVCGVITLPQVIVKSPRLPKRPEQPRVGVGFAQGTTL